jgi:hypothetical protein
MNEDILPTATITAVEVAIMGMAAQPRESA